MGYQRRFLDIGGESFQLIGDSMLKRLHRAAGRNGWIESSHDPLPSCDGSLTMWDLEDAVRQNGVSNKVLLMAGTNDLLQCEELDCEDDQYLLDKMNNLIDSVYNCRTDHSPVEKIILICLPPVPQKGYKDHIRIWRDMVSAIREWSDDVTVITTRDIFFKNNNFVQKYYEQTYSSDKIDQIHWNDAGAERVLQRIYEGC